MKKTAWMFLCTALVAWPAGANDGRDRYRGVGPSLLVLFPDPPGPEAGYRFLPKDMRGGADGTRAFRWARPEAVALVRLAAHRTHEQWSGDPDLAMPIFDASAENADTPVDFTPAPRGRHPGGSHDGGTNLDLGYYLSKLDGAHYSPDFAACTNHFSEVEKSAPGAEVPDAYRCLGPADRLDLLEQYTFLLNLFRINRALFDGELIEEVGVDDQVRKLILKRAKAVGSDEFAVADMARTMISDRWEGWAGSHHHHIHLRLRPLSATGRHRKGIATLLQWERDMDREMAKGRLPILRARLLSQGLERAVELTVLGAGSVRRVTFDTGDTDPLEADPFRRPLWQAVIDLPEGVQDDERVLSCEARLELTNGKVQTLRATLVLPPRQPHLQVSVDPARIRGKLTPAPDDGVQLRLDLPAAYQLYVTGVRWEIWRQGKPIERQAAQAPAYRIVTSGRSKLRFVQALVTLSGRLTLSVPVFAARPSPPSGP